jgi:hypothetical protein
MESDLQSLFGLLCTAVLIGRDQQPPPLSLHSSSYTRALLVSQDRRHFFVTPWTQQRESLRATGQVVFNSVLWIRMGFNADPNPDPNPPFYLNADPDPDPDPVRQTNADPESV